MRLNLLTISLLPLLSLSIVTAHADTSITSCNLNGNHGTPSCAAPTATNQEGASTNNGASNPINILTGNKFESATDIQATGGEYGLSFNRYYNSRSNQTGMLGTGWRHDYEMQLQDTGDQIDIIQADGRQLHFYKSAATLNNSTLFVTRYLADKPELGYLERTQSSDSSKASWVWHLPTGKQFEFITHRQVLIANTQGHQRFGQLSRVTERADDPNSAYWSLTYGTDGTLAQVDNHLGDRLKFGYRSTQGHPTITVTKSTHHQSRSKTNNKSSKQAAQTSTWHYLLDANNNLAQVVSPTGVRTGYAYTDPNDKHNLTAKYRYDDNKQQELMSQWTYDAYDRAISATRKGGIEKVTVAFDPNTVLPTQAGTIFTNRMTNSVGETTDYRYRYRGDDVELLSTVGAGCSTCGEPNVSYEYDTAGRVTKTNKLDSQGQVLSATATVFDDKGRMTQRMVTTSGSTSTQSKTHYEYVSNNSEDNRFALVAKEWQSSVAVGKQTGISYSYDDHGRPVEKTEFGHTLDGKAISRTYVMNYDNKGNLNQVALRDDNNPDSKPIVIEAYTWYADGSVKTSARPNLGQITTFEHDSNGQTTAIERKDEQETITIKIAYGDENLPMSMSRYHNGELVNGVKYQRNDTGDITSVTDLDDNFIASYAYDDARRSLGEITAKKASLRHLDTEGRPIVDYDITATGADKLSYLYDNKNRISAVGRDDTQLVAVKYSDDDNTAQILGASGEQTIAHNDSTQISDYSLPNMWDALGVKKTNIKSVQPGITRVEQNNDINTDYGYDDFGRIVYIDSKTAGRKHYQYDAQDQLVGIELANKVTISYQYDKKGRKINKTVKQDDKVVQQVAWKFDDKDQLLNADGNNQQIKYQYDDKGRVIQKRLSLADLATPLITSYRYDKDGSMISTTLPDGIELLSNDNKIRYKAPDDIRATAIYGESEHQASGMNQISYQLGQHIVMGHFYDDNGQFSGISYRSMPKSGDNPFIRSARADDIIPLFSQQWQRTSDGIVEQVTELDYQTKPTEHNYLYDSQYHLISSSYQPVELDNDFTQVTATNKQSDDQTNNETNAARYIYDELGNRMLGIDDSKTLKKYQYDDKGRLTTIIPIAQTLDSQNSSAQVIAYDAAGLPTQYGGYKLSYSAGQLSQVKDDKGQLVAEYSYNDEGQRIKKTVYQKENKLLATPETSYYVYEDSQLQHELDGEGNIIRHYVYIGNTLTATLDYPTDQHGELLSNEQSNISLWTRSKNWIGSLWGQDEAYPTINYVITDYLGRPRQVRDGETNALKWQFKPTAFGGQVDDSINNSIDSSKDSSYELNVRFPGQYEDTETGLYYNHWRYYDQDTGRYLSADPLGLGGGENLYTYVNATPTHFIDPPGLLLFAFDGTGNKDYGSDNNPSNVVKFKDIYLRDVNEPNFPSVNKWKYGDIRNGEITAIEQTKAFSSTDRAQNVFYISGAGTTDQYTGINGKPANSMGSNKLADLGDLGDGLTIVKRVDAAVGYLYDYLDHVYKDPNIIQRDEKGFVTSNNKITLDVVGFSRGAASARMFATKVKTILDSGRWEMANQTFTGDPKDKTSSDWKYTSKFLKDCGIDFNFNFMGLMDTVPAYGLNQHDDMNDLKQFGMSYSVDGTFKSVVHAVALNENRYQFARRSIFESQGGANSTNGKPLQGSKFRLEKGFLGAHSDIGGGYAEGDLSNASLIWLIKHAKDAGIKFNDSQIEQNRYQYIDNPVVHDSVARFPVYTIGGEFRWASDETRDFYQNSIFKQRDHLELSWDYIRDNFENPDFKKFDEIKKATDEYMALGELVRQGKYAKMLLRHISIIPKNRAYRKLKDPDNGKFDILIKTDEEQVIRINDYLAWLQCHYGIDMNTSITYDIKAPIEKDLCAGTQLEY